MNSNPAPAQTEEVSAPKRAAGSSFYTAMRILPHAQRAAMFEIYSFCRRVDDIADSDMPRAERLAGLAQWRSDIDALYSGHPRAALNGMAETVRKFSLRKRIFSKSSPAWNGCRRGHPCPDWAKLDLYCDRVASAVGRLSVACSGSRETMEGARASPGRALAADEYCAISMKTRRSADFICRARP